MSEHYFPNKSPLVMEGLRQIRLKAESLPDILIQEIFASLSKMHHELATTSFSKEGEFTVARQLETELYFPSTLPRIKLEHIVCGYVEWLQRKYCLPGFVEVELGDCIIDCGAFVGGFSLGAANLAHSIHVFEPDEINFSCCMRNLVTLPNMKLCKKGLYNRSGTKLFNISASAVEHSFLLPDDGSLVDQRLVDIVSLAEYLDEHEIHCVDFLKLEAEGVELEIYEGLGSILPRKLAIDVSPERDGKSPAEEFHKILLGQGYRVRQRGNVLFARLAE